MLGAQFYHFGNPLALVLFHHLSVAQGFFLTRDLFVVMLDALGIMGGNAFHFRLNLSVLSANTRFVFLQLPPLAGFISSEGLLASRPEANRPPRCRLHREP